MNKKQFDFFKDILKQRLDEHVDHADFTISELVSQRNKESDSIDKALADTDQSLKLRFRSRESLVIRQTQQALDRIANHSYGICESCGEIRDVGDLPRLEWRTLKDLVGCAVSGGRNRCRRG